MLLPDGGTMRATHTAELPINALPYAVQKPIYPCPILWCPTFYWPTARSRLPGNLQCRHHQQRNLRAFKHLHAYLCDRDLRPKFQKLDNEASTAL
jgi:hypothetical protein